MISEFSFSSFLIDFGGARLFLTSKSSKTYEKHVSETEKSGNFPIRFFDVFGTAKRRFRLQCCQCVVLDLPVRPARPKKTAKSNFLDKI